jgi:hypothetical protein
MGFLVVAVAQLVESRIVIPVVVGSSPISHPICSECSCVEEFCANVAKLVYALDLGSSGETHESSSLSFRTSFLTSVACLAFFFLKLSSKLKKAKKRLKKRLKEILEIFIKEACKAFCIL